MRPRFQKTVLIIITIIVLSYFPKINSEEINQNNILFVGGKGSGNYSLIQNAIDNASINDTIYILNGLYEENLVIDKPLNLVGQDNNKTIIDNQGKVYGIFVDNTNLNLSNLTITNSKIGVFLIDSIKTIIKNIVFFNNSNGLYLSNSSHNLIINNLFTRNSEGIIFYNSSNNLIFENSFKNNNAFGFAAWDKSNNNNISRNDFFKNNQGLMLNRWSNYNHIKSNNFSNNLLGANIEYCFENFIEKNNISNNKRGIDLINSKNNSLHNNTFINNKIHAIFIENLEDNQISESNYFLNNLNDIRIISKTPHVKLPSFEVIIMILISILLLIFFFYNQRKK